MRLNLLLAVSCILIASCAGVGRESLEPMKLEYRTMQPPGFFDVGIGVAGVSDTRGGSDDDAIGVVLSFKAYPYGRWYGLPKGGLLKLNPDNQHLISILHHYHRKKNQGMASGDSSDSGSKDPETIKLSNELPKDVAISVGALINDPNVYLSHIDRMLLYNAANPDFVASQEDLNRLNHLATSQIHSRDWHIVKERDSWKNRFSVFYARSVTDFDSGGLKSEVNAVGVSIDISPELALQIGRGFYEVDEGNGSDTDDSQFVGVSLNLFAFELFNNLASGQ